MAFREGEPLIYFPDLSAELVSNWACQTYRAPEQPSARSHGPKLHKQVMAATSNAELNELLAGVPPQALPHHIASGAAAESAGGIPAPAGLVDTPALDSPAAADTAAGRGRRKRCISFTDDENPCASRLDKMIAQEVRQCIGRNNGGWPCRHSTLPGAMTAAGPVIHIRYLSPPRKLPLRSRRKMVEGGEKHQQRLERRPKGGVGRTTPITLAH